MSEQHISIEGAQITYNSYVAGLLPAHMNPEQVELLIQELDQAREETIEGKSRWAGQFAKSDYTDKALVRKAEGELFGYVERCKEAMRSAQRFMNFYKRTLGKVNERLEWHPQDTDAQKARSFLNTVVVMVHRHGQQVDDHWRSAQLFGANLESRL